MNEKDKGATAATNFFLAVLKTPLKVSIHVVEVADAQKHVQTLVIKNELNTQNTFSDRKK